MDVKIKIKGKRGQITIFIILAIFLIIGIVLIFYLRTSPETEVPDEKNPQAYIESCTRDAVEEAIEILSERGGDIEPEDGVLYQGIERTYLCHTPEFCESCVNKRPMLIEHIEQEITNYTTPLVKRCFDNLKTSLEQRYEIEEEEMKLTTRLQSRQVSVDIKKDFKMTRKDKIREIKEFKMNLIHPIYNLAEIAMEIANQESEFCDFAYDGFSIIYPKYDIDKFQTGDTDIIYTVEERATEQKFVFAIRSCVMPAGYCP